MGEGIYDTFAYYIMGHFADFVFHCVCQTFKRFAYGCANLLLIVLATGLELIFRYNVFSMANYVGEYVAKIFLAIVLIGLMEMVLGKKKRNESSKGIWIGFWIVLILVILLGFRLPLTF